MALTDWKAYWYSEDVSISPIFIDHSFKEYGKDRIQYLKGNQYFSQWLSYIIPNRKPTRSPWPSSPIPSPVWSVSFERTDYHYYDLPTIWNAWRWLGKPLRSRPCDRSATRVSTNEIWRRWRGLWPWSTTLCLPMSPKASSTTYSCSSLPAASARESWWVKI